MEVERCGQDRDSRKTKTDASLNTFKNLFQFRDSRTDFPFDADDWLAFNQSRLLSSPTRSCVLKLKRTTIN